MADEKEPHWSEALIARGEPVGQNQIDAPLSFGETEDGEFGIDYSIGPGADHKAIMMRLLFSVEAASSLLDALQAWRARRDARGEETKGPIAH